MTPAIARLGAATLLLATSAVPAQGLYRNVDANGRVTYSDRPPAAAPLAPAARGADGGSAASASAPLPYELRQAMQRYPVTIYTSENCAPCATGRTLLQTRGIPFEERTVKSAEGVAALERLSGRNAMPLLTIGSQQLRGFSDVEWSQYLDAAGYPKSTQLPAGYRNPPAQPLVAQQHNVPAAPAAPAPSPTAPAPAPAPVEPAPANPAGIRF